MSACSIKYFNRTELNRIEFRRIWEPLVCFIQNHTRQIRPDNFNMWQAPWLETSPSDNVLSWDNFVLSTELKSVNWPLWRVSKAEVSNVSPSSALETLYGDQFLPLFLNILLSETTSWCKISNSINTVNRQGRVTPTTHQHFLLRVMNKFFMTKVLTILLLRKRKQTRKQSNFSVIENP